MRPIFLFIFFLFSFLSSAQHQDKVDFRVCKGTVGVIPKEKAIQGKVVYIFDVLKNVDSVFLDAKNMEFSEVALNNKKAKYNYDGKRINLYKQFKQGSVDTLTLVYKTSPKQTVYFLGWDDIIQGNEQIWTQGQGKYTSHWLPSFDDMEEKVEFDLGLLLDKGDKELTLIANGSLETNSGFMDSPFWIYDMQKPMSSYLLAFAIGNYEKQELKSNSGIPIENYYYPQDSLKVEPTYRYTKEIFDFLEDEIDFPYPWQNYKQIPVRDFLYAGMENTTATIFSDGYMIDSTAFADKNYVNVNAHELAHQWFGNLVTEKNGNHHWLHEGFATYYAYLAERQIFSNDHFCWRLYNSLLQLKNQVDEGKGESLLDPNASSLTFYEKGALALFMLREQIGDLPFRIGVEAYLEKYQFKNVTVSDFLSEMELSSGQKLDGFKKDWLENKGIPFEAAKSRISKKAFSIKPLFKLEEKIQNSRNEDIDFKKYWNINSIHLKKHILENYYGLLPEEIILKAFDSDSTPIRQVIARKMDSISPSFKGKFESLLEDESYLTIENTLFKLWVAYPENKAKYLEQTKDVIGLPNKNVRLLWLTLAILTNDYDGRNTQVYFKELNSYTSKEYGWEIRMGAFQYLNQALGLNEESLRNLVDATNHHSWQFKKFARNLVGELIKDEDYKSRFEVLVRELSDEETSYLKTKFK